MQPELSSPSSPAVRRWWQRPSVISLLAVLSLIAAALVLPWWLGPRTAAPGSGAALDDLPWRVRLLGEGRSEVFGLQPGGSTLADVEARFGDNVRSGLITPMGGEPALESFVETFQAGFITGRLVLAYDAPREWTRQAQGRAPRNEVGEGGRSRRYGLAQEDLASARQQVLMGLSFMPSASLDEATVRQRFGEPSERLQGASGEVQLLYPALGVAIALPPEGERARALIQYVAPAAFEARLRAPLRSAVAASAPASR